MQYQEHQFAITGLDGLSDKQIAEHLKLYAGYVKNTNALMAKIAEYTTDSEKNAHALSELKRRMGFEWNGMRLHELYFSQLGAKTKEKPEGKLLAAIEQRWGSFDAWLAEFKAMGVMRGIGWVLLVNDDAAGMLHNIWVADHELGNLAGAPVVLAMDVWEHAYLLDYPPAGRKDYIEAFFRNMKWEVIEARFR